MAASPTEPVTDSAPESNVDRALDLAFDLKAVPRESRAQAIRNVCGGDAALERLVARLLAASDDPGDFLSGSIAGCFSANEWLSQDDENPSVPEIQGYAITGALGRGGMGVVYEAVDLENANRPVALKVLPPLLDQAARIRFDDECRAMANLVHPNIAVLYHSGIAGNRPFVAMERVNGVPIDRYCDEHSLSIHERLKLIEQVCFAIAHAHEHRVLHQDVKPSNLLVTSATGSAALVKVIDFGISAVLDEAQTAQTGRSAKGSIGYVSPERAENPFGFSADTREDVYGIGAVLFKLLSGSAPRTSDQQSGADLRQTVDLLTGVQQQHAASVRSSGVGRWVRVMDGDLRRITSKALALDRKDRYRSPIELAEDLRRYRSKLPISAGMNNWAYRARLFLLRRWGLVTAVVVLTLTLVTATLVSLEQARIARIAQAESEQVTTFVQNLFAQANPSVENPEDVTAVELLERGLAQAESELGDQPALLTRVLEVIGTSYAGLARFDLARDTLIRAVTIGEPVLDSRSLGNLWLSLGDAHRKLADFEAAGQAFNQAEPLLAAHPPDYPSLANVFNSRANILFQQYDFAGAEALHREAYAMRAQYLGEDALETGVSANNVAAMLIMRRQEAAAQPFLRKAHGIFEARLPPSHAWLDQVETNLATSLGRLRQWDEANAIREQVLDRQRQRLGDAHPALLPNLTNTSDNYRDMGMLDEASRYLDLAEGVASQAFEPGHPQRLRVISRRGAIALARMDFESAIDYYEASLSGYSTLYGPDHHVTLDKIQRLGLVYLRMGNYEAAAERLTDARNALSTILSDDHFQVLWGDRQLLELALLTGADADWAEDLLARHANDTIRESERFQAAILDARLRHRSNPVAAIAQLENELADISEQVAPVEAAEAWRWLAHFYSAAGRKSDADAAIETALSLLDDSIPIHRPLMETLALQMDR